MPNLGKKQEALESCNQALAIWRSVGNRQGEALTLNSIGRLYRDLGQQQTALDYYNQALPMWREVGSRNGEALALSDIGRAYADHGATAKGAGVMQPGVAHLARNREPPRRSDDAEQYGQGLFRPGRGGQGAGVRSVRRLPIWREVKDRRGEAMALMTIGWAYSAHKETEKALASELAALSLAKAAGDPEIEGAIETTLMIGFRKQHRPEEAIFFGMEAVNAYQQIRKNISGLDKDLQAGFAQSKSQTYRMLAELAGRSRPARRGRSRFSICSRNRS